MLDLPLFTFNFFVYIADVDGYELSESTVDSECSYSIRFLISSLSCVLLQRLHKETKLLILIYCSST